jgi:hypothetical protein
MSAAADTAPFTSAEMQQILDGRAIPDDLLARRHATKQRDGAQIREFHAMQGNPDLAAIMDRMTALEAVNESLIRRVAMLEARVPIVPAHRRAPYLDRAKNGCSRQFLCGRVAPC